MKKLFSVLATVWAVVAMTGAQAGGISDVGVNAYWGADGHGYGDVIGNSTYDISGATITRVGSVLTISIATNFAGHAGVEPGVAVGGIGYGDVFLSQIWNPFGTDANHTNDNAANGTQWSYGLNLDNRFSNNGGSFTLYNLKNTANATNATSIYNSEKFMTCVLGTACYYRNGEATAVNTTSSTVKNTGLTGNWTVTPDKELRFTIDIAGSADLMKFSSFAMHWGETCQNDVIEGITRVVPTPGSLPLIALGMGALLVLRRRQGGAAAVRAA